MADTPIIDTSHVISPCEAYRYVLYRRWAEGGKTLLWVLLNPSRAEATVRDQTDKKGVGFSKLWGFNAYRFVNLFAYRSTKTHGVTDVGLAKAIGPENDHWLDLMIAEHEHVMLAWGGSIPKLVNARVPAVAEILARHHRKAWCLGLTDTGQPKHPVMLGYDTPREPVEWAA